MEQLINAFVALNTKEKEYFILAITPEICKVFQKDADSIPKFCKSIRKEAEQNQKEDIMEQLYQLFAPDKDK